jgi:hypothetical protein
MAVVEIETRLIAIRPDARKVDETTVRGLVNSIAELGIINPLRVRPARRYIDGVEADAYEVTAGVHRLKAARKLGLVNVPCTIVEDDDLHAELAMIDENLCRAELSPADRAASTARRKAIYLELHPETEHGANQHSEGAGEVERFTAATAAVTGRSERAVQLDAERGTKISEQAISLIRGSSLDSGQYLDKIKKLDADQQADRVARDLERARAAKLAKPTPDPLDDEDAAERQVAKLMSAWNGAGADARAEFLLRIGARQ